MRSNRVVIVGGGVSGLAAAHRLLELQAETRTGEAAPRLEVVLLEASGRLGGTVRTVRRDGFLLEGGPDSFISEKPAALELAARLGLTSRVIETNAAHRRSFVVRAGSLRPTPEGFHLLAPARLWPFLTSDIFSWRGKARMALDLLLPRRGPANGGEDEDESLAAFVRRRFGQEALERMAQPMVGGIYTADPERLSLRATMPRFLDMERQHRSLILALWKNARRQHPGARNGASGARYGLFLSFDEGMQVLTDALAARLPPAVTRPHARVEKVVYEGAARTWSVRTETGETLSADAVCVALPAYAAARLLRGTDDLLASELDAIPYASTATVNLAYKRPDIPHPLDGFGFVAPFAERRGVLACTFSSVKFPSRAPEGHALLRAFVGGALQPELFELNEGEMVSAVRRDLRELLGIRAAPLFSHVERWPRSMAQYHVGHLARLGRVGERLRALPGLRLCGNAYTGAGIPDCVRGGEEAADAIFKEFTSRRL